MGDEHANVDAEDGDDNTEESDGREHADKLDSKEHPGGHDEEQDRAVQAVVVQVHRHRSRVEDGKHRCNVVLYGQHYINTLCVYACV